MVAVTQSFASKVAAIIGADPGYVYQIFNQWQPHEGGSAAFNPLNTTQSGGEASNPYYNTFGDKSQYHVRNYASEDAGARATAQTLLNGNYPNLVKGLQTGNVTAAAAPEVRKWGTTGFAAQLEGGGATTGPSGPGTPGGSGVTTTGSGDKTRLVQLQKAWDEGLANEPTQGVDPNTGQDPHAEWVKKMTLLQAGINSEVSLAGQKDTAFGNATTAFDSGMKLDTLNQQKSVGDINRFMGGLKESDVRAQMIADAKTQVQKYGAPAGKTSYSFNELGAGFSGLAKQMGWDPGGNAIAYGGQTYLDPQGDIAAFDKQFGVTGQIPQMANVQSGYNNIPQPGDFGSGTSAMEDPGVGAGLDQYQLTQNDGGTPFALPFSPWAQNGQPGAGFDFNYDPGEATNNPRSWTPPAWAQPQTRNPWSVR